MTDKEITDIWEAVRKQERFKSPFWEQIANQTIVSLLEFVEKGGAPTNLPHLASKMAKHHRHRIGEREARYIPTVPDEDGFMVYKHVEFDKLPEPASNDKIPIPERKAIASEVLDNTVPNWREEGFKEINDTPDGRAHHKKVEKYAVRIRRFLGELNWKAGGKAC